MLNCRLSSYFCVFSLLFLVLAGDVKLSFVILSPFLPIVIFGPFTGCQDVVCYIVSVSSDYYLWSFHQQG